MPLDVIYRRLSLFFTAIGGKLLGAVTNDCCAWDGPLFSVPVSPDEFRKELKKLGLSQSEAARRLYVGVSAVQRWASGTRSIPGPVIACLEAWTRHAEAEKALKKVKAALDR